jgi:oligopeptide/dipeptide ABC transporter ATP-binding protein
MILLEGEIFSPINPKPGCRFAPRCRYAAEVCHSQQPELRKASDGHLVACHLFETIDAEVQPPVKSGI